MNKLDQYSFSTRDGFNAVLIQLRYQHISQYFRGESCLEFGCADGEGTKLLLPYFKKVVAVDGSKKLISKLKKHIQHAHLEVVHSFFEDFQYPEKFDTILLAHVLEHVDYPVKVLKKAKHFLKKNGVMIFDVPNALSIHRQMGVEMGLLHHVYELNEADRSIGHQRVYDMDLLVHDAKATGLKIIQSGGIFLKCLSNAQLEKILDKNQILAFAELGKQYPHIAAEIFLVCQLPSRRLS